MDNHPVSFGRRKEPANVQLPEGQVRVIESHHAADFEMDFGQWPFHKICWVAVGRGRLESPDGAVDLEQNHFLLLPANWVHRFADDPKQPLTLVILCVSEAFFASTENRQLDALWDAARAKAPVSHASQARTSFHRSSLIENFRLALREQGNRRMGWETALRLVAARILISFSRDYIVPSQQPAQSSRHAVEGAIEYVDTHVYESLQIDELATRCDLSPRRFTDLFKQQTGKTFSDYLNQKRIEYACQRLKEAGHIQYACHESGFNDLAYFYRVFKKVMRMTPGEYLKHR